MKMIKVRYKPVLFVVTLAFLGTKAFVPQDSHDPAVKFEIDDNTRTVHLTIDENVPSATLFNLTGVEGTPYLDYKDEKCAGFDVSKEIAGPFGKDSWSLNLNKPLDYEEKNCHEVRANIMDQNDVYLVLVTIINLDDNPPYFIPSPCSMDENRIYNLVNTTCSMSMTDADGMMNRTKFSLEPNNKGESLDGLFNVSFRELPDDDLTETEIFIHLLDEQMLDFESTTFYMFTVHAKQQMEETDFQVVINVIDQPDQPPKWVSMFITKQFEENIDQTFSVKAIDGDVGINNKIIYDIDKNECKTYKYTCEISIDKDEGQIMVKNVDREEVGDTLSITIMAIEIDHSNQTSLDITFFIQDQDDEVPCIDLKLPKEGAFRVDENYMGTITEFSVKDMDLKENGTYDIKLDVEEGAFDYTGAFKVIPNTGYQESSFTLTVFDSKNLDYENETWKVITFNLLAVEEADKRHTDLKKIIIKLNDLNDEPPIFVNESSSVNIPENIKAGELIFNAIATDADAGDVVTYEIEGIWSQSLDISKNGLITPKKDDVFDYEQLQQVVIQMKASDNDSIHQVYKTLTINVQDIDDEPPVIHVGSNRVAIEENTVEGTILKDANISGSDPDTKPDLTLEIDWSRSSISKNSAVQTAEEEKWQCFELYTEKENINSQKITGILKIGKKCSPDFELFDTISIGLKVVDKNTVIRNDTAYGAIVVNIIDLNDNPPVFDESSFIGLEVTDGTNEVVNVGTIYSHDDDINDKTTYSIKPLDSTADWIEIDPSTGKLSTKKDVVIDDDIPVRFNISFIVTASDSDNIHVVPHQLDIHLKDVNDEIPQILKAKETVTIQEKRQDGDVFILSEADADRDDPFNRVAFKFDTNITESASDRFDITSDGTIVVRLRKGATLDRDYGEKNFTLPVLAYDNPQGTLQWRTNYDMTIILEDINDHEPELKNQTVECNENWKKGEEIRPLVAEDPDEGLNGTVIFQILEVVPIPKTYKKPLTTSSFEISSIDDKSATIKLLQDLQDYYGVYNINVEASDKGTPVKKKNHVVELSVKKFNFKRPTFTFPKQDSAAFILDQYQDRRSSNALKLIDGQYLQDFDVNDNQDHKYPVLFQIIDEDGKPPSIFNIKGNGTRFGRLSLAEDPPDSGKNHSITIEATLQTDQQPDEVATSVQIKVIMSFFDNNEEPKFVDSGCEMSFEENSMETPRYIPQATYSIPNVRVFYIPLDNTETFNVDIHTGNVSLKHELDYEQKASYIMRIAASNKESWSTEPTGHSVLTVTVNVIDLNDHEPIFYPDKFNAPFLNSYSTKSVIVTINAIDEDPRDKNKLEYSIGETQCKGKLNPKQPAFVIDKHEGKVTPTFTLTSDMSGYCVASVSVKDDLDKHGTQHTVTTTLQINIVSDDELVEFVFRNEDFYVYQEQEQISQVLDSIFKAYQLKSHLADYKYDAQYGNTTAHFYFLNATQYPIKGSYILGNLTDPDKFSTLKRDLGKYSIYLEEFPSKDIPQIVDDYLRIWLFVTTIVLATLLMLVSITFFFRNKALTDRIRNLSTTKFGSQESGLNRAGVTAPTTNKHAIEGSNPVFNSENFIKEMEPDSKSIISEDSDLFGVENNPEFDI